MGDLSDIAASADGTLTIRFPRSWTSHHFQGQPVMPAVEAMQLLAGRVQAASAEVNVREIGTVRFPKFLAVDPDAESVTVRYQATALGDGGRLANLSSTASAGSARIRRSITHAEAAFGTTREPLPSLPLDLTAVLEGVCDTIDPHTIYRELVPFGIDYQSICAPLVVSGDGALARVQAPLQAFALPGPLGSGFPLDGAFHAACVWGQRYAGRVAFPVAIGRRVIASPTRIGEIYTARVVPVDTTPKALIVDIWILDATGACREAAFQVEMRDVSRGSWQPPDWIVETPPGPGLFPWVSECQGMVLIERAHIAGFGDKVLSPAEATRLTPMGARRRQGFIGGRIALKRLWRQLARDRQTSPVDIDTLAVDGSQPVLPEVTGKPAIHCSLAHDDRFCVAVAHHGSVGIDVAPLTERILKSGHLFMQTDEQAVVQNADMNDSEAALRVWSVKEAASKAFGIALDEAWEQVKVISITDQKSRLHDHRGRERIARHGWVAGHLVTVVAEPA
jgi:phosphopantetheinyl transferase